MKVFLGGTCNKTTWRDELIIKLEKDKIDYYNPVVDNWTPEDQQEEIKQKDYLCDTHLYYITSAMTGVFSIAEAVDSAYKNKNCIFTFDPKDFDEFQIKSLTAVGELIDAAGGIFLSYSTNFVNLIKLLKILNNLR